MDIRVPWLELLRQGVGGRDGAVRGGAAPAACSGRQAVLVNARDSRPGLRTRAKRTALVQKCKRTRVGRANFRAAWHGAAAVGHGRALALPRQESSPKQSLPKPRSLAPTLTESEDMYIGDMLRYILVIRTHPTTGRIHHLVN